MGTISFEWPVDDKGYSLKRGVILRNGGEHRWKRPLDFHNTLFMQFARLDGSGTACVEFANAFGYLGLSPDKDKYEDRVGPAGEPLKFWHDSIVNMRARIETWQSAPEKLLQSEFLIARLDAVLVPSAPDGRPALSIRPRSLIAAMNLQFAQAVARGVDIRMCEHCGEPFEAGGEHRRIVARFCSDKCRVAYHNSRKRSAR